MYAWERERKNEKSKGDIKEVGYVVSQEMRLRARGGSKERYKFTPHTHTHTGLSVHSCTRLHHSMVREALPGRCEWQISDFTEFFL